MSGSSEKLTSIPKEETKIRDSRVHSHESWIVNHQERYLDRASFKFNETIDKQVEDLVESEEIEPSLSETI